MHLKAKSIAHPSHQEHAVAVAIVVWIMILGFCMVAANAWAAAMLLG